MQRVWLVLVAIGLTPASSVLAQVPAPPHDRPAAQVSTRAKAPDGGATLGPLLSDLGRELVGLPSKSTAVTLGLGGLAALAVHPADATLSERASRSIPLDELLEFGAVTGDGWMQGSAALATFAMGRATGSHSVQAIGADLLQAQIVAAIMTHGLKVTVGRRRPDGGRRSFPSGHSSGTFANATVLQRDLGWKVGLPAYGLATYVAASRLSENRHYASDVIFGAAVGLVAGRTVTVGHGRRAFEMAAVGVPGGVGVAFTHIQ